MKKNESYTIIARTFKGLEEYLAEELDNLGLKDLKTLNRAVYVSGNLEDVYRINYTSRFALDVLIPIAKAKIRNADDLYKLGKSVQWDEWFDVKDDFAIHGIVYSNLFDNTHFATLKLKDSIADYYNDKYGERPDVNQKAPKVKIALKITENYAEILLNSSGAPLFKRGYRKAAGVAPINEILAAALVKFSEWDKKTPFIDPMCGSGTIPIEAAMMAYNIPSGYHRSFAFQNWKNYEHKLFKSVKEEEDKKIEDKRIVIKGMDRDLEMVNKSNFNVRTFPILRNKVKFETQEFIESEKPLKNCQLVFNPPYNEKIRINNILKFYEKIGATLKHGYPNTKVTMISGNKDALFKIGLRPSKKLSLRNGAIDAYVQNFEIFEGNMKDFKTARAVRK